MYSPGLCPILNTYEGFLMKDSSRADARFATTGFRSERKSRSLPTLKTAPTQRSASHAALQAGSFRHMGRPHDARTVVSSWSSARGLVRDGVPDVVASSVEEAPDRGMTGQGCPRVPVSGHSAKPFIRIRGSTTSVALHTKARTFAISNGELWITDRESVTKGTISNPWGAANTHTIHHSLDFSRRVCVSVSY